MQKCDEVGSEQRVSGYLIEPASSTLDDFDLDETYIEELLDQRGLRQRARQSTRERCGTLEHFLG